ncbi:hypothetical protein GCM10009551_081350 [Nocardiopsis tropica]
MLDVIEAEGLAERADTLGKHIATSVESLGHPLVTGVRGSGLLLGITLAQPVAKAIETGARDAGFLINAAQADVVRLAPPLVLTDEQADRFVAALPALLDSAQETS